MEIANCLVTMLADFWGFLIQFDTQVHSPLTILVTPVLLFVCNLESETVQKKFMCLLCAHTFFYEHFEDPQKNNFFTCQKGFLIYGFRKKIREGGDRKISNFVHDFFYEFHI